ncbi:TRAP transporter large permease [Paracoccus sp. Z330]|uniref:TRAP transporter large permease protein n=1 Tax=Paracoccus onchidii TaxID=3017813 RepID=A0ABT4ZD52_9RHOB|nr:TRAP transporter large permease [Paracoccus onchidii]MDB6177292.1 TRAP transporter large permease [Paracoccus onchidii]
MPVFVILTIVVALLGMPIVFALSFGPIMAFVLEGRENMIQIGLQRFFAGVNQFPLLAIPLFILAGEIMNAGDITRRLVNLSKLLVGHMRGGLAHVNILSSVLFAGLSGSAVADTTALGSMMIPAMEKDGYTRRFATAVTAASSIIGPVIPPSIIMIVYAYIMNVSVGALFAAGFIPGLLMGVSLMLMTAYLARKHDFPRREGAPSKQEIIRDTTQGFFPLLTPVIILGGILLGIVSPTEAAVVAVVYALGLSLCIRSLGFRDVPRLFVQASRASASVLLMVGSASLFGWALNMAGVPQSLATAVLGVTENPIIFLLLINLVLFVVGMFLDAGPAILIVGPILGPTMLGMDISPVHFAVIMCLNLTVGLATPPFGLVLFASAAVSGLRVGAIVRAMLPFYIVHVVVLLAITMIPDISLALPRWLGFPV